MSTIQSKDPAVASMVSRAVEALPKEASIPTRELYEKAIEFNPEIAELSVRQFHGKYVLQACKARSRSEKASETPAEDQNGEMDGEVLSEAAAGEEARAQVREVLVEWAGDVEQATRRGAVVPLLGQVDDRVAQVMGALGAS